MNHDLPAKLWELARHSRWFPGSGHPVGVEVADWVLPPEPGPGLRSAVLIVDSGDGHLDRFHIPLAGHDDDLVDACDEAAVLLEALRIEAPGFERLREVPVGLEPRRFGGEQSNTSVFFGEQLLVKVFRRLEPGRNVDVELHRALAGTGVVAELYGVWSSEGTDLAVFLESLPEPADGYVLASRYALEGRDFSAHAHALGESLATVHRVLADRLPTSSIDGSAVAAACRRRFDEASREITGLLPYRDAAMRCFARIDEGPLPAQRVHGDCHLGQALLSAGAWRYVDFEGEPLKSMEERRAPDSPLRDVAGMLRSFSYAAAAGAASPQWLGDCRAAFLDGYGLVDSRNPLLIAYETDKAAYEAQYEARYRPHLLDVPLSHLAGLDHSGRSDHAGSALAEQNVAGEVDGGLGDE